MYDLETIKKNATSMDRQLLIMIYEKLEEISKKLDHEQPQETVEHKPEKRTYKRRGEVNAHTD